MKVLVVLALVAFVSVDAHRHGWRPQVDPKSCLAAASKHCPAFAHAVRKNSPALAKLLSRSSSKVTVFCPTDAALAAVTALPKGVSLENVLNYHVVRKSISSKWLLKSSPFTTLLCNKTLTASKVACGDFKITAELSSAIVKKADISCGAGRLHIVDAVLVPKACPKPCAPSVTVSSPPPVCQSPPPNCPVAVSSPPPACQSPPPNCPVAVSSPPPVCHSPPPNCPVAVSSPPPVCHSPPPNCPVAVSSPPPVCHSPPPNCPVAVSSPPPVCASPPPNCPVAVSSPPPKCASPPPNCPVAVSAPPPCATCTTIYAAISADPDLSILKLAVDIAGLSSLLNDPTLVATVYAPNNKAFQDIGVAGLVANKDSLIATLKNHVVPGVAVTKERLVDGVCLQTLTKPVCNAVTGYNVVLKPKDTDICASIVTPNIKACAAIIHKVSAVLVPCA